MNKTSRFLKENKELRLAFFIFLIPILIPLVIGTFNKLCKLNINLNTYNKYFEIYGGYIANILTVFISMFTIKHELNKLRDNKIKARRIELHELLEKILIVNKKYWNSKSIFFEIYSRRNIEKHIEYIENIGGVKFSLYKDENKNWKEKLIRKTINRRWELLKEFLKIKGEIAIDLESVLNNKLLFNPIDEIEKEELRYSEVKKYIDVLEEYFDNVNSFIRGFNQDEYRIERMFLKHPTEDQEKLDKYIDDMEKLLFNNKNFSDALDLIELYLSFTILYLKTDLIYVDDNWKKEFLEDYNEKFYNMVNRNEIFKDIVENINKEGATD